MNAAMILDGKVYGGNWSVKSVDKMPEAVAKQIRECHVVNGDYGLQLCLFLKSGGQIYKKLSVDHKRAEGEVIKPEDLEVVTLSKPGEDDIIRFR